MRVIARCYDRVIVQTGSNEVAEVELRKGKTSVKKGALVGDPGRVKSVRVPFDPANLEVHKCDGCSNFGPRGAPRGTSIFQQFALLRAAHPWKGNREGWWCMGCSHPPR